MTFKEKYRELYADIYRLHERHYKATSEGDWLRLIDDISEVSKKYNNDKFITGLLANIVAEIERVNFQSI